jgi:hypothetical protein
MANVCPSVHLAFPAVEKIASPFPLFMINNIALSVAVALPSLVLSDQEKSTTPLLEQALGRENWNVCWGSVERRADCEWSKGGMWKAA